MLQPGLLFTVPGDTSRHKGAFNSSSSLEILTSSSPDLASFWNSETFYSYLFAPTCHQFVTILFHFPGHFLCFTIQTSQLSFKISATMFLIPRVLSGSLLAHSWCGCFLHQERIRLHSQWSRIKSARVVLSGFLLLCTLCWIPGLSASCCFLSSFGRPLSFLLEMLRSGDPESTHR